MSKKLYTLTEARERAGLTRRGAAERLGIMPTTLKSYETYSANISVHRAKEVAALYGLEMDNIIFCMAEIDDVKRALKLNGVTENVTLEQTCGRIKVTVNGEYYGIWDTLRRTFVD